MTAPRPDFRLLLPPMCVPLLVAAMAGFMTVSCAVAPATVRRVGGLGEIGGHGCRYAEAPLEILLERALVEPGSAESAHALAHFVERWQQEKGEATEGVFTLPVAGGVLGAGGGSGGGGEAEEQRYRVRFTGAHMEGYSLSYFDEISPAVDYRVRRLPHYKREGIGAPLVALRENLGREPIEAFYPPEAITRPLTAVLRDQGTMRDGTRDVEVYLLCPMQHGEIEFAGKVQPVAADFSVPWAMLLSRAGDLERNRLLEMFRREPLREARLLLMEPYDPDKEPLIMVHGLMDTPLAWAELSNELWADDEIRARYQIWHYHYNTSAPALYSGRILRTQLRELRAQLDPEGDDKAMESTTLLGHSMGGIVSRTLITSPGEAFWEAAFVAPFEDLDLSDEDRASLKEAFYWEAEPHVKRVIYMCVPHLGSDFADNFVGRLGTALVKPPVSFAEFYGRITERNPGVFTEAYAELGTGMLDSVHALSPRQPTLKILAALPNAHPVREFSIIGNRGRRGPAEDSSDGIVEYWSSHLERAESERMVPSGHGAINDGEAVAEIKRILKLP